MLRTCGKYIYSGLDCFTNSCIDKSCQLRGVNAVFNRSLQKDVNKPNSQRTSTENGKKTSLGKCFWLNKMPLETALLFVLTLIECHDVLS